jgi:hypothetical protein
MAYTSHGAAMPKSRIYPAECVIKAFGGVRAAAKAIGITHSAVSQWGKRKPIPSSSVVRILEAATKLGLHITPFDLVIGRIIVRRRDTKKRGRK